MPDVAEWRLDTRSLIRKIQPLIRAIRRVWKGQPRAAHPFRLFLICRIDYRCAYDMRRAKDQMIFFSPTSTVEKKNDFGRVRVSDSLISCDFIGVLFIR